MKPILSLSLILFLGLASAIPQTKRHTFTLGEKEFLLDGKPLQMS